MLWLLKGYSEIPRSILTLTTRRRAGSGRRVAERWSTAPRPPHARSYAGSVRAPNVLWRNTLGEWRTIRRRHRLHFEPGESRRLPLVVSQAEAQALKVPCWSVPRRARRCCAMGVALAAMTAAKTTAQTPVPIRVTPQSARESAYLNDLANPRALAWMAG